MQVKDVHMNLKPNQFFNRSILGRLALFLLLLNSLPGCTEESDPANTGDSNDGVDLAVALQTPGSFLTLPTSGLDQIQGRTVDSDGDGSVDGMDLVAGEDLQVTLSGSLGRERQSGMVGFVFEGDSSTQYYLDTSGTSLEIVDEQGNSGYQLVLEDGKISGLEKDGVAAAADVLAEDSLAAYYAGHRQASRGCLVDRWFYESTEGTPGQQKTMDVTFGDDSSLHVEYFTGAGGEYIVREGSYEYTGRHILLTFERSAVSMTSFADAESNLADDAFPFRTESDIICGTDYLGLLLDFQDIDFTSLLMKRFSAGTGNLGGRYSFMTRTWVKVDGSFKLYKLDKYYLDAAKTGYPDSGTTHLLWDSYTWLDKDNSYAQLGSPTVQNIDRYGLYDFDGSLLVSTSCPDNTYSGCSGSDEFPGRLMDNGDYIWGVQLGRFTE
jgi:hypothetical protein